MVLLESASHHHSDMHKSTSITAYKYVVPRCTIGFNELQSRVAVTINVSIKVEV